MIPTIKSEYRKLFSVRSTYFVWFLTWLFIVIFGFWVEGYKGLSGSAASLANNQALADIAINGGTTAAGFLAIIAILYVVHEYRYNMIMYTLTASNSRTKVLVSKLLVITTFSIGFTLLSLLFAYACYSLGLSLRHVSLPAQDWNIITTVGRVLFLNTGFMLLGFIIGLISRNIAAAIAFVFLFPNTIEPLLGLLLKTNAVYLPFAALQQVAITSSNETFTQGTLTVTRAMLVSGIYVMVGLILTWVLFLRRDAN